MESFRQYFTPFNLEQLEPASYDLLVGDEAYTADGKINIEEEGSVKIPRGSTVTIVPREELELSTNVVGRSGLRSQWARRGIMLLSGPQIDPGFQGILTYTLYNAGTGELKLGYGERLGTIEFSSLRTEASRPYEGKFQHQEGPSNDELRALLTKHKSIQDLEIIITQLKENIHYIQQRLNKFGSVFRGQMSWVRGFLHAILGGLIIGVIVALVQILIT